VVHATQEEEEEEEDYQYSANIIMRTCNLPITKELEAVSY